MTAPRRPTQPVDTLALMQAIESGKEENRKDNESLREVLVQSVTAISERTSRLERDAAKGEMTLGSLQRELGEVRLALGDLRDLVELKADGQVTAITQASTEGAARGSAHGAVQALKGFKNQVQITSLLGAVALAVAVLANGNAIFTILLKLFGVTDLGGGE